MNAAKYNKGTAIEKLAEIVGIPMERTMAMGDAENDIGAFKIAAEAVCMANGNEYMKSLSTKITDLPNYEGGLGDFLIKFFDLK
ncbi:MAG: HAD family hydrolase [Pikeienuella sp.]